MFISLSEMLREIKEVWFPVRQFYYIDNGETKFWHFNTARQIWMAGSAALLILFCAALTYDFWLGSTAEKLSPDQAVLIKAEYSRLITDTEARYAVTAEQLSRQQAEFDAVTARLMQKQDVLMILEELGYLDDLTVIQAGGL